MECPICGLENPNSALKCDCGFDFKTMTEHQRTAKIEQKIYDRANGLIYSGLRIFLIGFIGNTFFFIKDYLMPNGFHNLSIKMFLVYFFHLEDVFDHKFVRLNLVWFLGLIVILIGIIWKNNLHIAKKKNFT